MGVYKAIIIEIKCYSTDESSDLSDESDSNHGGELVQLQFQLILMKILNKFNKRTLNRFSSSWLITLPRGKLI